MLLHVSIRTKLPLWHFLLMRNHDTTSSCAPEVVAIPFPQPGSWPVNIQWSQQLVNQDIFGTFHKWSHFLLNQSKRKIDGTCPDNAFCILSGTIRVMLHIKSELYRCLELDDNNILTKFHTKLWNKSLSFCQMTQHWW